MPKSTSTKGRKSSWKKSKSKVGGATNKKRKSVKSTFKKFVFSGFYKPSRRMGQGGVLPKTRALGRLIRWPKYVKLQRQRKVLMQRIVIPPALNMFNYTAPKPLGICPSLSLFSFIHLSIFNLFIFFPISLAFSQISYTYIFWLFSFDYSGFFGQVI